MNILIVKLSAIGDVVHTLPSLTALRSLYPNAHISWVVEESASDIIKGHPHLDRVIISHRKRWIQSLKVPHTLKDTMEEIRFFIKTLRDRRYDLAID
ncbi:MAG: lipopolysaccharide heptosyltransferase I, partial [Deltaproteobacteria bacterium]|nr:lipopolysaccharide heptosyltransferase I [Deltaproteobacteria bacterium]